MSIEVVDWSPEWADQFEDVAAVLREALHDVASAEVEHVGSTSVPGPAAKPILDVDVVVDPADVPAAVRALVARHGAGENHSERLWALVTFEMWQRIFFDGEAVQPADSPARRAAGHHAPARHMVLEPA